MNFSWQKGKKKCFKDPLLFTSQKVINILQIIVLEYDLRYNTSQIVRTFVDYPSYFVQKISELLFPFDSKYLTCMNNLINLMMQTILQYDNFLIFNAFLKCKRTLETTCTLKNKTQHKKMNYMISFAWKLLKRKTISILELLEPCLK